MADLDVNSIVGVVDKRAGRGTTASPLATPGNYVSIATLRARLAVINAGYYTATKLDQMTKNDMIFAVRTADDPLGM